MDEELDKIEPIEQGDKIETWLTAKGEMLCKIRLGGKLDSREGIDEKIKLMEHAYTELKNRFKILKFER